MPLLKAALSIHKENFMDFKNCFTPADFLLPKKDFSKWAVIACDQYTSEQEYWRKAKEIVGDKPSALNCILPEVYLKDDNSDAVKKINEKMDEYAACIGNAAHRLWPAARRW